MAKRKRIAPTTSSRKRAKGGLQSSPHPHGEYEEDREYKIKSIINENKAQYLIKWEDDEVTGQKYKPTWEPKANANQLAIDDWENQKAAKQKAGAGRATARDSRQSSVRSSPAAPARPSTPSGTKRARQRKVVESSPPIETPEINGHRRRASPQVGDLLEIGESQQSQSGAQQEADSNSPLFVQSDSPSELQLPEQTVAAVHVPAPPSSYLAGGYEVVSSSQPAPSTAPQERGSPEPSQYLPDTVDTSKTTEDTTEVSLAPTTPSQQTRLVPGHLGQSSANIVPDSQTLLGSSDFVPSDTGTKSSSAPEATASTNEVQEPSRSAEIEKAKAPPHNVENSSLRPEDAPAQDQTTEATEVGQPSSGGEFSSSAQVQPNPSHLSQELATTNVGADESIPTHINGSLRSQQVNALGQSADAADSQQGSQPLQLEGQNRATDSMPPRKSAHLQAELPTVNGLAESANGDTADSPEASLGEGPEHPSSSTQFESQPRRPVEHSAGVNGAYDLDEQPLLPPSTDSPNYTVQEPPAEAVIDLITQGHSTSISGFTPTPPPRRVPTSVQQLVGPHPNSSVSWTSPWPFQTQLARPVSAGTNLPGPTSQHSNFYSQLSAQDPPQISRSNTTPRASSLPLGESSPLRNSSPIPTAPSRSGGILLFGESAPPRPNTPSSPLRTPSVGANMSASQTTPKSGMDLKDLLAEVRQRHRNQGKVPTSAPTSSAPEAAQSQVSAPPSTASAVPSQVLKRLASPLLSSQHGARSPSAAPASEPLPIITTEEMQTSERYETLLPQAQDGNLSEGKQNGSLTTTGTPVRPRETDEPETTDVHAIPLSLVGHQRDQYPQMIWHERELIQRVLNTPTPSDEMIAEASRFVQRMRDIVMHPDLVNAETLTQYEVKPSQQADWAVSCSAKFRFLRQLLNKLRHTTLHIAIVAKPSRIMDILETFLQGSKIAYQRPCVTSPVVELETHGICSVTLLAADTKSTQTSVADLVIAMDDSVSHDTNLIRHLRKNDSKWAPFVTLIIPRSVEHVERCLSLALSDRASTRALVSGIYQFRNEAGKLEDAKHHPEDSATALARYLTSADRDLEEWPLSNLSPLDDLDSQTQSETEPAGAVGEATAAHAGDKRSREADEVEVDATGTRKRTRVEESTAEEAPGVPATIHPQEIEITHISDSVDKTTQSKVADDEPSSPTLNNIEKRLQELLIAAQTRLEEHVQALSGLQYRFEEQRSQLVEARNERDSVTLTAQTAITRLNEQANSMSKLRAERTDLKQQVEEANKSLLDHSVPERAAFEVLRLAAAQANIEKEKADKRLVQANNDLTYVRQMYQESSTAAKNHANQISELENGLAVVRNRATGEQARLRQMGYDALTKNLQNENRKLKAMLKDREEGMKFRDEEIARMKEASRGRMGTRGTSVPRSPRIGSPMRSRQGSPAIGEMRGRGGLLHPLRNA